MVFPGISSCVSLGLYSDATPVYHKQSMIAGHMNITWARRRYVLYAILKDSLCKCGCNGKCTMDPIQLVLNASINMAAAGMYMPARFDGCAWTADDHRRSQRAGQPLGKYGVLTEYRADWPELSTIFGFKTWTADRPSFTNMGGHPGP